MASPLHFPTRQRLGTTLDYDVALNTTSGEDVALAGDESLSLQLWTLDGGSDLAASTSSSVAPQTPAEGVVRVTIDADATIFEATVYRAAVLVDGVNRLPVDTFLRFLPVGAPGEAIGTGTLKAVDSGDSPYCTTDDFLHFYDANHIGQLLNDDGSIAAESSLAFRSRLETVLRRASGEIEAACIAGRRYRVADLRLISAHGGNGSAYLAALVADYAMATLKRRRGGEAELTDTEKAAVETIDKLRSGERILPFAETADAGLPDNSVPTRDDLRDMNLVTHESYRYFGNRQRERRFFGGGRRR